MEAEIDTLDESRPSKKQRLFIARQACEHCRQKKTRCDENQPCRPCRTAGLECSYGERKASKNEVSLSMILHKLERMDAKIDQIGSPDQHAPSPTVSRHPDPDMRRNSATVTQPISFSAHLMGDWPAVRELLPPSVSISGRYSLEAEEARSPLPVTNPRSYPDGFLTDLSISAVRELSDAYFATFNLMTPVLDRKIYFQQTLGNAINGAFGFDADSCIVLMTMALGCWGTQAVSEALRLQHQTSAQAPDAEALGLAFYNEARKRIGFLECDHTMQTCQFYLLAAIYHGQLVRPVDCWSMLMRASTCCLRFWSTAPEGDEWTLDMYSRLFWITVMIETVLTQELPGLPTSKIRDMEDQVPLPKFVQPYANPSEEDESFYHYHFLSQIAHRMFLTRVYNSSYYSSSSGDYPNPNLSRELYHQLDQWRSQLPPALRFDDATPESDPTLSNTLVVAWLRARYSVARYHIGRPFLYKALHHPEALTDHDRQRCRDTLQSVLRWSEIMRNVNSIKGCNHLAFFVCGQTFGQLLLMYCFLQRSELRALVPEGWEQWSTFAVQTLHDYSVMSPGVARDAEIAIALFPA